MVETVFIEGHTDNVDIHTDEFPSNWELSTKRAINTWNLMRGDVPELDRDKNANEQPIFSCSGYADTRPIVDDEYDEDSEEVKKSEEDGEENEGEEEEKEDSNYEEDDSIVTDDDDFDENN